jgi:hypothetical protein
MRFIDTENGTHADEAALPLMLPGAFPNLTEREWSGGKVDGKRRVRLWEETGRGPPICAILQPQNSIDLLSTLTSALTLKHFRRHRTTTRQLRQS